MLKPEIQKDKTNRFAAFFFFLWISCVLIGCGSDSSDSGDVPPTPSQKNEVSSEVWEKVEVRQIQAGGMLIPNVQAKFDDSSTIHLTYFTDSQNTSGEFTLNHTSIDLQTITPSATKEVIDIDNCRALGLALGAGNSPVVAYQGGEIRECGQEQQSDVMVNIGNGGTWSEATAGIGYVERNPVFTDGLAGRTVSVAADSSGNIHVAYQFFYEGCDAMNFNYPDLVYVRKQGSNPDADATEETVEGNVYNPNGTASAQNNIGDNAKIIVDASGDPAIFYYANLAPNNSDPDQKGLRVARKKSGTWSSQWIETGIEVSNISAGVDQSGNLAVAYHVESSYTDSLGLHEKLLKYAVQTASSWNTMIVDESVQCGKFCSLSFNADGNPAIAYYATENHSGSLTLEDLKFAEYTGTVWESETVSAEGDIGHYNSLWFDNTGTAYICSYSDTLNTIFLFYR